MIARAQKVLWGHLCVLTRGSDGRIADFTLAQMSESIETPKRSTNGGLTGLVVMCRWKSNSGSGLILCTDIPTDERLSSFLGPSFLNINQGEGGQPLVRHATWGGVGQGRGAFILSPTARPTCRNIRMISTNSGHLISDGPRQAIKGTSARF